MDYRQIFNFITRVTRHANMYLDYLDNNFDKQKENIIISRDPEDEKKLFLHKNYQDVPGNLIIIVNLYGCLDRLLSSINVLNFETFETYETFYTDLTNVEIIKLIID